MVLKRLLVVLCFLWLALFMYWYFGDSGGGLSENFMTGLFFYDIPPSLDDIFVNATFGWPTPRAFSSCVDHPIMDAIYCFGGYAMKKLPDQEIMLLNYTLDSDYYKLLVDLKLDDDYCPLVVDGNVFCAPPGGRGFKSTDGIFIFSPRSYEFYDLGYSLFKGTEYLSCVRSSLNNKIYCFGGRSGDNFYDDVTIFDPFDGNIVKSNATLGEGRAHHSCVESSFNNKIYCFGGSGARYMFNDVYEYDPLTDKSRIIDSVFPERIYQLSCVDSILTHKIYCFGGAYFDKELSKAVRLDRVIEFDPNTLTSVWKNAKLPQPARLLGCVQNSENKKIYCFGGDDAIGTFFDSILEYDVYIDRVRVIGNLQFPRSGMSCVEHRGTHEIYCFGGLSGNSTLFFNDVIGYSFN